MMPYSTPHIWFPIMFNNNIGPNLSPLWEHDRNISDLEFYLSKSLKVKCYGAIGLPIYDFLVEL